MRRIAVALLVLLGLVGPAVAQAAPSAAPGVVVRQGIDPESGAVVGQHVALHVDVLFHDEMPRPPRVSLPEVPGLQIFRFETQGLTINDTVAGESYIGQRFEYAVYARRGGTFDLPAAKVTLLDRDGAETGTAAGVAVPLVVGVPAGIDASAPVVATGHLTLDEQWAPDPKGRFKAGDALVRTIARAAEDVPGLAMRDLTFAAPEGVRIYIDPPDIDDHSERGVLTGRRTDRVTYVFERGGRIEIPALAQPWWDLKGGTAQSATAAGVTIDVAAAPAADAIEADARVAFRPWLLIGAGLVVLALSAVVIRRRRNVPDAEAAAFAALRKACKGGDPAAAYRSLAAWRNLLEPGQRRAATDAAMTLDAVLFAESRPDWDHAASMALLRRLSDIRGPTAARSRAPSLAPLNPVRTTEAGS